MQLTFLEAKVPLTKSYAKRPDGSYKGGGYPGVTSFTSMTEAVASTADFAKALETHAGLGHCLLTNSLTQPIVMSSRAKLSDKEELRQWIILDIDGIEGIANSEDFIQKCLPTQFHNTSYVVQHSPSSGIKPGVRTHLFFLLHDEVDVRSVSAWLKYTNLDTQLLSDQIALSKNSMALSFKLDWVANNNGRIIYITPPGCEGFSDPVTERIQLVEKKYDKAAFNFAAIGSAQMRARYKDKINELRAAAGLKISRKEEFYVLRNDKEYVVDALVEPARITDPLPDNDQFMRCNLDGGDSYAYYYHRINPTYLYNFKGEPGVKMRLCDPEFYDRVAKPDMEALQAKNNRPFVFRDNTTDKYYAGVRKEAEVLTQPAPIGSILKIEHYFAQHGQTVPPDPIPSWDMVFDPTSKIQWIEDDQQFNTWRPTEYQKNAMYKSLIPVTIDKIIAHVVGNDPECYHHFINWLAYIYQTRTKSGTAWVLHGVPGTGKGLLFNNIIVPIFGRDYCQSKMIKDLADKFNGWMERCIFANIDETNSADARGEATATMNALKNWITEPHMSIRQMQAAAVMRPSYVNFIFTANDFGMLPIQDGDRRFNVAPRQEIPISVSAEEVNALKEELQDFAGYLQSYEVDEIKAHTPLENKAKSALKLAAESSIDTFFRAISQGDLEYFIDGLDESTTEYESLAQFKVAVAQWMEDARNGVASDIDVTLMKHAHVVMCRDKSMKDNAFKSMAAKRGCAAAKYGLEGYRWYGWQVQWNMSAESKAYHKLHIKSVRSLEAEIAAEIKSEKAE